MENRNFRHIIDELHILRKGYVIAFVWMLVCTATCNKKDDKDILPCNIVVVENDIVSPKWLVHLKDSLYQSFSGGLSYAVFHIKHQDKDYILFESVFYWQPAAARIYCCTGNKLEFEGYEPSQFIEIYNKRRAGSYLYLFDVCFGKDCTSFITQKP